jgi:hypothetical protein
MIPQISHIIHGIFFWNAVAEMWGNGSHVGLSRGPLEIFSFRPHSVC